MAYIEFRNITKKYGDNTVVDNLNLSIEEGSLVTLLGPSGCGKSTLLRSLAGFEQIQGGEIYIAGEEVSKLEVKKRNVGMVFQHYSLFPTMNVYQNIAFGLKMKKVDNKLIEEKVNKMIEIVDLKGKEKSYPNELSGGQKQRVALARALVTDPKVLLLDEPLSAIDALLRKSLQVEIRRIQKELNITTIFVTHDQDEAMLMSDMIHVMNKGVIEQSDRPEKLYVEPKTTFVANFIGHYNVLDEHDFKLISSMDVQHSIAIRPEVIELSSKPIEAKEGLIVTKAIIKEFIVNGNILRYTIAVNGVRLQVDELYRSFKLFKLGEEVYMSVEKRNCLKIV